MIEDYYTVEQISSLLKIHPKTVQRYIREGKLRATKIGKGWRVAGHDLSAFTESETFEKPNLENQAERRVTASAVIDIMTQGKEEAVERLSKV